MKLVVALAAATAIIGASLAQAQTGGKETPGHEMQEHGSVKGSPGASGYAPGHEMKKEEHGTVGKRDRDHDRDDRRGDPDHLTPTKPAR